MAVILVPDMVTVNVDDEFSDGVSVKTPLAILLTVPVLLFDPAVSS
jgi:hypothetical protein